MSGPAGPVVIIAGRSICGICHGVCEVATRSGDSVLGCPHVADEAREQAVGTPTTTLPAARPVRAADQIRLAAEVARPARSTRVSHLESEVTPRCEQLLVTGHCDEPATGASGRELTGYQPGVGTFSQPIK